MPKGGIIHNPQYTHLFNAILHDANTPLSIHNFIPKNYKDKLYSKNKYPTISELRNKLWNLRGKEVGRDKKKYHFIKIIGKNGRHTIYSLDYPGILKHIVDKYLKKYYTQEQYDFLDFDNKALISMLKLYLMRIFETVANNYNYSINEIFKEFVFGIGKKESSKWQRKFIEWELLGFDKMSPEKKYNYAMEKAKIESDDFFKKHFIYNPKFKKNTKVREREKSAIKKSGVKLGVKLWTYGSFKDTSYKYFNEKTTTELNRISKDVTEN